MLKSKKTANKHSKKPTKPFKARTKNPATNNKLWICGKHPVLLALKNKKRKIFEILVTKNSQEQLQKFLAQNHLTYLQKSIKLVTNQQISAIIGPNQIHQGIAINCSKLAILDENTLLKRLENSKKGQNLEKLLILDQISDPHNIGAIIRSAIAFGVKNIIFSQHNAIIENATIVKSSAGAIEFANLSSVTNISNLLEKLKKIGYWCVGLAGEGSENINNLKNHPNLALVIGSEGSGIRSLVKKNCDILAKITINNQVESLNASVATAIALYELSSN